MISEEMLAFISETTQVEIIGWMNSQLEMQQDRIAKHLMNAEKIFDSAGGY